MEVGYQALDYPTLGRYAEVNGFAETDIDRFEFIEAMEQMDATYRTYHAEQAAKQRKQSKNTDSKPRKVR